ncbi:MAG: MotA/TolQ/ExbB proton channel family protein [Candidatus Tectomicrobia bacterium]|nr:MotA/TolQ/ExbB proton channel family protein [Candidatus Tectomicrobia bacterium]
MTTQMLDYVARGGIVMIPILVCSVVALIIIFERLWSLQRKRIFRFEILDTIEQLLREQKIPEATTLCKRHDSTMTRLILVALLNSDRPKAEIKELIEDHGRQEVPFLERYLTMLGTIASISPFLGLLGTVVGLLRVFDAISQEGGVTNAAILSSGIQNALITTVAGLCVAIPSLVAYNYFARRAEGLVLEVERISLRLLNILKR